MNQESALTGALMRAQIEAQASGATPCRGRRGRGLRSAHGSLRTPRELLLDRARTVCGRNEMLRTAVHDFMTHPSFESLEPDARRYVVANVLPAMHDEIAAFPGLVRLIRGPRFGALSPAVQMSLLRSYAALIGLPSAESVLSLARHPVFARIDGALQAQVVRVICGPEVGTNNSNRTELHRWWDRHRRALLRRLRPDVIAGVEAVEADLRDHLYAPVHGVYLLKGRLGRGHHAVGFGEPDDKDGLAYFLTAVPDRQSRKRLRLLASHPFEPRLTVGHVFACARTDISVGETLRLVSWIQQQYAIGTDWRDPLGEASDTGGPRRLQCFHQSVADMLRCVSASRGPLRFDAYRLLNGRPAGGSHHDVASLNALVSRLG